MHIIRLNNEIKSYIKLAQFVSQKVLTLRKIHIVSIHAFYTFILMQILIMPNQFKSISPKSRSPSTGLTANPNVLCDELIEDIAHPVESVQQAAACALGQLLVQEPKLMPGVLDRLLVLYQSKLAMIPSKLNDFGRVIEQPIDTWGPRRGVALALAQLAPLLTPDTIHTLIQFFVKTGLGDRDSSVRNEMFTAAVAAVDLHGKNNITSLLPVFEEFMDKAPKSGGYDCIKQSVVILMGSLARHLDKDDPRIKPIVTRLIAALSTPSQQVFHTSILIFHVRVKWFNYRLICGLA